MEGRRGNCEGEEGRLTTQSVRKQRTADSSRRETARRAEHHILPVLALVRRRIGVLLLGIRPVLLLRGVLAVLLLLGISAVPRRRGPVLRLPAVLLLLLLIPPAERPRAVPAGRGGAVPLVLRPLPLRPRRGGLGVVPPRLGVVVQRYPALRELRQALGHGGRGGRRGRAAVAAASVGGLRLRGRGRGAIAAAVGGLRGGLRGGAVAVGGSAVLLGRGAGVVRGRLLVGVVVGLVSCFLGRQFRSLVPGFFCLVRIELVGVWGRWRLCRETSRGGGRGWSR